MHEIVITLLAFATLMGLGYSVDYILKEQALYATFKTLFTFYIMGCVVAEGFLLLFKRAGGRNDNNSKSKN